MQTFLSGMGLGLMLASLIGPVFFALIETSLRKGLTLAIIMAMGITLSDSLYILAAFFGLKYVADNSTVLSLLGLGGGLVLIFFGIGVLFSKPKKMQTQQDTLSSKDKLRALLKGFVLNFINPSVLLFWVGSVGLIASQYNNQSGEILTFFAGTTTTVLTTDVLKARMAYKISTFIQESWIIYLQKAVGVGMILFGAKLLWDQSGVFM